MSTNLDALRAARDTAAEAWHCAILDRAPPDVKWKRRTAYREALQEYDAALEQEAKDATAPPMPGAAKAAGPVTGAATVEAALPGTVTLPTVAALACSVCGAPMTGHHVTSQEMGRPAWIEDDWRHEWTWWYCEHAPEGWHRQAAAILKLADGTPSRILEGMLRYEAEGIVEARRGTKEVP